ncbi:MAG: hypothetical protein ACI9V1_003693 [Spirosomataceae bacterium]|jgi:hypothetical protein
MQFNPSERQNSTLEIVLLAVLSLIAIAGIFFSGIKLW